MKRRRGRRVLLGLLTLVLGLAVVAAYILHPSHLTPRIEALLTDLLRGDFTIERVAWVPPWSVAVDGFVLTATTGDRVLRVERVTASVDPAPLLAGHLHIHGVRVRGVDAHLTRTGATYTLVEAFQPRERGPADGAPSTFALAIDDIRIEDVRAQLDEPGRHIAVRGATVADAALTFDGTGLALSADVDAPAAVLALDGLPELRADAVSAERVRVGWDSATGAARVAVARGLVTLPGATVELRGGELSPLAIEAPIEAVAHIEVRAALPALSALLAPIPELAAVGTATITADVRGELFRPAITATVVAAGLRVLGRPIVQLHAAGGLTEGRIAAEALDVELGDGGRVRGRAAFTFADRAVDAALTLTDVAARAELGSPYVPERVSGELSATGGLSMLTLSAALAGGGASLGLRGTMRCDDCTIGAPETALDLAIELRHGALTPLVARQVPGVTVGRTTLVARARGTLEAPRVAGDLRVLALHHPIAPPADAAVRFRLDGARLVLLDATVTSSVGRAHAVGDVWLPLFERSDRPVSLGLDVDTSSVSLAWLTRGVAHGTLRAQGRIDGAPTAPTARLTVTLGPVTLPGEVALEPVTLEARAGAGTYTLARARVARVGGGGATVEGSTDGTTVTARLLLDAIPLAALAPGTPLVLSGALDAAIAVDGPLANPRLDAELEAPAVSIGGVAFSRALVHAVGPLDALAVDARLVGLGGTVKVEGTIDTRTQTLGETQVLLRHLALPAHPALAGVGGRVDAELTLSGPLPFPDATGRLTLRDLRMGDRPLRLDALVLDVEPAAPGIYSLGVALGTQLGGRALLTLSPAFGITGFAEARALSLRPVIEALIARGVVDDEGAVTDAVAIIGGNAELSYDARGVRVSGELRRLDLSSGDLKLSLEAPAHIAYAQDELVLGRVRLEGLRGSLEVEGTAADTLDLRARADVNAAVLSLASRQIQEATGRFTVDGTVRGDRDAPVVEVDVVINEPVVLRPRVGVREVVLSSGHVRATRDQVTVEGIDGAIAGGTFHVAGSVGVRGGRLHDIDLALDGTSLPLRTRDLGVEANLNLRLTGSDELPRLAGRLEIVRARYQKKFRLENFAFVADTSDDEPSLASRLPWLRDLELDLRAQSAGDIELDVDATGVKVTLALGADVTVTGTPLEPRLGGRIRAETGRLRFPRADLEVTTADIDLDPFPAPGTSGITVHLVAEGEVPTSDRTRTHLVRLVLEGPLEQMSLDLQSAGFDRLAVLSLLITGRIGLDREGALAFAGSQLAAPLTGFLENQLEKALNLGIKLDAEVSTSGVRVTATREITRRLIIESTFQREFDTAGTLTTGVRAILFLFDRAFLEAHASQTSQAISTPGQLVDDNGVSTSVELKYQLLGR